MRTHKTQRLDAFTDSDVFADAWSTNTCEILSTNLMHCTSAGLSGGTGVSPTTEREVSAFSAFQRYNQGIRIDKLISIHKA